MTSLIKDNYNKIIEYDKNTMKDMFPIEPNIDYSKLQMTTEGMYSITYSYYAEKITNFIKQSLSDDKIDKMIITDATANVGGNSLNFSKYFKSVNSIEISDINCKVLKNNLIDVYKRNNINIICSDFLSIYKDLEQDIIFMDPPWGGKNYKKKKNIVLKLSNVNISLIIKECFKHKLANMLVIKVPSNINLNELVRNIHYKKIEFFKIKNYGLIIIKNI